MGGYSVTPFNPYDFTKKYEPESKEQEEEEKKEEPEFDFTPTKTLASKSHYEVTLSRLKKFSELVITHPA